MTGAGAIALLRALCLALPEASEKEAWGSPTFRVRDRMFALARSDGGVPAAWLKGEDGAQELLTGADPARFFRPPYFGHRGWIGVRLDPEPDWEEVVELVTRSYRLVAPKRLAGLR